jgi:hypothetical protein
MICANCNVEVIWADDANSTSEPGWVHAPERLEHACGSPTPHEEDVP